ncbi:MAG: CheR family methyltransferase [Vicinamibacterales bacterium]
MNLSHIRFEGIPTRRLTTAGHPSSRAGRDSLVDRPAFVRAPQEPLDGLAADILRLAGLNPHVYRRPPLERRVPACLRALKTPSEPAARTRALSDRHHLTVAVSALLIGVSSFFRDAAVFEAMRATVIPRLRCRPTIRVLSVGCSSGAELYSVAILLAEAELLDRAELIGTDCRADALIDAAAGVFDEQAMAAVPSSLQARYFERTGGGWRVSDAIRQSVTWVAADATASIPEGPWDLVLCRNLVIYLQESTSRVLFRRLTDTLSPGGFLVVGRAERPPATLPLTALSRSVYQRHDASV